MMFVGTEPTACTLFRSMELMASAKPSAPEPKASEGSSGACSRQGNTKGSSDLPLPAGVGGLGAFAGAGAPERAAVRADFIALYKPLIDWGVNGPEWRLSGKIDG